MPGVSNRLFEVYKPKFFAQLAAWIYDDYHESEISQDATPFAIRKTVEKDQINFGYITLYPNGLNAAGINVFVVRGTDNLSNVHKDINEILAFGHVEYFTDNPVSTTLKEFATEFGPCSIAVGHSLGGKLIELVCGEAILGISFNGFSSNKNEHVISFRTAADVGTIATFKTSYTTHLIAPKIPGSSHALMTTNFTLFRQVQAHSIKDTIKVLHENKYDWTILDMERVNKVLPSFANNTGEISKIERVGGVLGEVYDNVREKIVCQIM